MNLFLDYIARNLLYLAVKSNLPQNTGKTAPQAKIKFSLLQKNRNQPLKLLRHFKKITRLTINYFEMD